MKTKRYKRSRLAAALVLATLAGVAPSGVASAETNEGNEVVIVQDGWEATAPTVPGNTAEIPADDTASPTDDTADDTADDEADPADEVVEEADDEAYDETEEDPADETAEDPTDDATDDAADDTTNADGSVDALLKAPAVTAPACSATATNKTNRFGQCVWVKNGGIKYYSKGILVGSVRLRMKRVLTLNPRKLKWTEKDSFKVLAVTGEGVGTSLSRYTVLCGKSCSTDVKFTPQVLIKGDTFSATVKYTSTVPKKKKIVNQSVYGLIFNHPSFGMEDVIVNSGKYRCDKQLTVNTAGGCVFYKVRPTMTEMRVLTEINKNIARIQKAGSKHYGSKTLSKGKNPLVRQTAAAKINANRNEACPTARKRAAPSGFSCDEYPFASTAQGAANVPASEWGWAYVPEGENDKQGGLIGKFFSQNRVLRGDAFWVAT
nr:NucA/NucB deoxyribonuclease domain-containing protein [Kineosporia mesophila]